MRRLDDLARGLKRPVDAPELWERIEASLGAEQPTPVRWTPIFAAAAALLAVALLLNGTRDAVPSALLADAEATAMAGELERWEARVAQLEPRLHELSGTTDVWPAAEQLAYLDANLERCRRAASTNSLNRAVRRSLVDSTRRKALLLEAVLEDTTTTRPR